jgi:hypothetical protein
MGIAQWRVRGLGGDLEARPVSSSRGLRIIGQMRAPALWSASILVSLPLCFQTQILHYLCISLITQELM